jgi:hypothetical protein
MRREHDWVHDLEGALGALSVLLCAAVARAQDAAAERAQSFQAVQGAVQEDVPGGPLLVAAYAVIWVLVVLFVMRVVRQQRASERDLARLERQLGTTPD